MDKLDIAKRRLLSAFQQFVIGYELLFNEPPTLQHQNTPPPVEEKFPLFGTQEQKYEFALNQQKQKRAASFELAKDDPPHIDKLISDIKLSANDLPPQKEIAFECKNTIEEENHLRLNKNIRKRKDGRYEWRQTLQGISHQLINSCLKTLCRLVKEYKAQHFTTNKSKPQPKESRKLIDLVRAYYKRHKEAKVKAGKMKATTAMRYISPINNYIVVLDRNIDTYTKDEIIDFFNDISAFRTGACCYSLISNVFKDEHEQGKLKRNPISSLKNPFPASLSKKGTWIDIEGQRKIMANLDKCSIGEELLFYLLTGCRREEAFNTVINFEKCVVFIDGTKTKTSVRHVELTPTYCERLKKAWHTMFKKSINYYTKRCSTYLESLGIENKTLHSMRHTFSSNHFYLGTPDKKRQMLLGHKSIAMTNDVYTTYDPTVTRKDILDIYGDLYPIFDPNFDPKNTK